MDIRCFNCPIFNFCFARSSAYHHALMIDTYGYLCYGYFGCQCNIVEKSPREGSKMGGYALDLYVTKLTALMCYHPLVGV